MAITTDYASLQTNIADFLWRTDLVAQIPGFIQSFEAQVSRRLVKDGPVRNMLGRSDASMSSEFTAIPTDFLGARALYLGVTYQQMTYVEPEKIVERKSLYPNYTGDPSVYSIVGPEIQLWPWSQGQNASPYSAELTYWRAIPALSASNTTNWLLNLHPDAYLYGSLLQSAPYLKDDSRITTWGTFATTIIDDIIQADKVARWAPQLETTIIPGGTFDGPRAYYP